MSLFTIKIKDHNIGYVRNHKCGSETILNYFYAALYGTDNPNSMSKELMENIGWDNHIGVTWSFPQYEDILMKQDIRIAVWRDPVEKFVKAFFYQRENEPDYKDMTLSQFIRMFPTYKKAIKHNKFFRNRFTTNTEKLGADRSVYTHVYNFREIDTKLRPFLEELSGNKIKPTVIHRTHSTYQPTAEELAAIKKIVQEDFDNGWC